VKRENRINAVLQAVRTTLRSLRDTADVEWLQLDLTMAQVKALFVLRSSGALPVGGLAERLKTGLPAASILTDRLVQLDLVERREDPHDRRRTFVQLSPTGEQLANRLHQGRDERLREWLIQLNDADCAALVRGLQALAKVAAADPKHKSENCDFLEGGYGKHHRGS
jgi:MarR family transcriptional regulator, organic hydroperoxide resistance regulator